LRTRSSRVIYGSWRLGKLEGEKPQLKLINKFNTFMKGFSFWHCTYFPMVIETLLLALTYFMLGYAWYEIESPLMTWDYSRFLRTIDYACTLVGELVSLSINIVSNLTRIVISKQLWPKNSILLGQKHQHQPSFQKVALQVAPLFCD